MAMSETLRCAVESYAFLIKGSGKMSGKDFADIIRTAYDISDLRASLLAKSIEDHVLEIEAYMNGCVELRTC